MTVAATVDARPAPIDLAPPEGLRAQVAASGRGWGPLLAISGVAATDQAYGYALVVLAPEIAKALHVSVGALATVAILRAVAFFASGGVATALAGRPPVNTARVVSVAALARVVALAATALLVDVRVVAVAVVLYGVTAVSTPLLHARLLHETYGPGDAVETFHRAASRIGNAAVAATIVPVAVLAPSRWQTAFLVLAGVAITSAVGVLLISGDVRARTRTRTARPDAARTRSLIPQPLGWVFEHRSARTVLVVTAIAGMFEIPMYVYVFSALWWKWGVHAPARALLAAGLELTGVAIGAVIVVAGVGRGHVRPERAARSLGVTVLGGACVLATTAVVGAAWGYYVLVAVALVLLAPVVPLLFASTLSMLPPLRRTYWTARSTSALVAVAVLGSLAAAAVARGLGPEAAAASVALPMAVVGFALLRASRSA